MYKTYKCVGSRLFPNSGQFTIASILPKLIRRVPNQHERLCLVEPAVGARYSSNKFKSSNQAWDYSFERVSLTCTLSLARKVEPLSTRCLATILVTLSAAFFGEWRFSRRMLLFVHLSSASLASYSTALTVYVFYPNNHFCLASFCEPNSLACQVLSTFHNIPEQSFAFCIKEGFEPSPIP